MAGDCFPIIDDEKGKWPVIAFPNVSISIMK
ncbi:hypothetical protein N185_29070 [Sinorhizobium sp. GW3]|nr:hypothetical protein N185_29070 [Sinorhizobium sp. GW3]